MSTAYNITRKIRLILQNYLFVRAWYFFNYLDGLKNNFDLFSNAREMIIYAGELYPGLYDDENFMNNFRKSINAGCKVTMVFGPAAYVENRDFLKLACHNENIKLYKRAVRDKAHFKIIKDHNGKTFAIVDKPHDINIKDEERQSVLLWKGFNKAISSLEEDVQNKIKECTRIDCLNFIDEFYHRDKIKDEFQNDVFYGFISKNENGETVLADDDQIDELANYIAYNCLKDEDEVLP